MKLRSMMRPAVAGATAAFVLALAACSSGNTSAAVKPDTFEVGGLFAMTGQYASYGEQQTNGVKLAFEQINADGGAGGSKLKLLIEDTKGEPTAGTTALNKLATVDKVPLVFTSVSNVISATAPIGTRQKVVMLNGGGTSPLLKGLSPYLFSNVPLENNHIQNIADYAYNKLGLRKLGILLTDDALGQGDADAMEETWKALGGEVVGRETAETSTTTFRSQLTSLKSEQPDVIYMALGGQHIPIALNQRTELGIKAQVLGTSFWTVPETIKAAKGASEGVVFSTQQWDPSDPSNDLAKKFVDDYTAKYGDSPQGNAAAYYVGAHIVADVVADLNDQGKELTGDNIKQALIEHGQFDTIFGPLKFSEDGTSEMPLTLLTVKNGQFTPVK